MLQASEKELVYNCCPWLTLVFSNYAFHKSGCEETYLESPMLVAVFVKKIDLMIRERKGSEGSQKS